jgi:hypothetical protein
MVVFLFLSLRNTDGTVFQGANSAKHRTALAKDMTRSQIEAGQNLTREMVKPGNVLRALDNYLKK